MPARLRDRPWWENAGLWYPNRVRPLTVASAPPRFPGAFLLRALELARWRLRGLLAVLPARGPAPLAAPPGAGVRIAYLFAGTYGDFVQALRPLARLAATYPRAEIVLWGADRYAREFASELPANARVARAREPWTWVLAPVDLMVTNCVGVYRVRFDWAARFCARRAFGFRHSHEARRGGFAATLPLLPAIRSFADENLKVLDLAGISGDWAAKNPGAAASPAAGQEPWGRGKILFHIGSAGLKRDFGSATYARLVLALLNGLEGRPVEVIMGPGDEEIAQEVRNGTGHAPQLYPLPRLIRILRSFEGTVLCFNSFPAHICHYLGKPAVVLHRLAVPYGYDCAPLHRQVILRREDDWDLTEAWQALGLAADAGIPAAQP
jgi:ADP-heptose:LPS heptosyltransferase